MAFQKVTSFKPSEKLKVRVNEISDGQDRCLVYIDVRDFKAATSGFYTIKIWPLMHKCVFNIPIFVRWL